MLSLELLGVPLIFSCPRDHVADWQPRPLLGVTEARPVTNVNTRQADTRTWITDNNMVEDRRVFGCFCV